MAEDITSVSFCFHLIFLLNSRNYPFINPSISLVLLFSLSLTITNTPFITFLCVSPQTPPPPLSSGFHPSLPASVHHLSLQSSPPFCPSQTFLPGMAHQWLFMSLDKCNPPKSHDNNVWNMSKTLSVKYDKQYVTLK